MFAIKDDQGKLLGGYGPKLWHTRGCRPPMEAAMRWHLKGEALDVVQKEFDGMADRLGIQVAWLG